MSGTVFVADYQQVIVLAPVTPILYSSSAAPFSSSRFSSSALSVSSAYIVPAATYYQRAVLTGGGVLSNVSGVALDSAGRIYITSALSSSSGQVVVLSSDGSVLVNLTSSFLRSWAWPWTLPVWCTCRRRCTTCLHSCTSTTRGPPHSARLLC